MSEETKASILVLTGAIVLLGLVLWLNSFKPLQRTKTNDRTFQELNETHPTTKAIIPSEQRTY